MDRSTLAFSGFPCNGFVLSRRDAWLDAGTKKRSKMLNCEGQRPTIRTVAQDAGVSRSAVSKVLCNAYGVSPELRARVMTSIDRLGYRPLTSARAMRGRTFTIGIVASEIHNPFFADVIVGVSRRLKGTPFQSFIGFSLSSGETELSLVDALLDRQVNGLIWIAPRIGCEALDRIAERMPLVLVAYHTASASALDTANVDDELGARLAVDHLVSQGYQRIAMVSVHWPGTAGSVVQRREQGFQNALKTHGIEAQAVIVHTREDASDVAAISRNLLNLKNRPDAIFCWNDFAAMEMLSSTKNLGLRVPEDIAIMGFDNTSLCRLAQNSLSSIDQFAEDLGESAATMLLERIDGRAEPRQVLLSPKLVVRTSTGKVSKTMVGPPATDER